MENRPIINSNWGRTDKIPEILCLWSWLTTWMGNPYQSFTPILPLHPNGMRYVTCSGHKSSPGVGLFFITILYRSLSILKKYLSILNAPITILQVNAEKIDKSAIRRIRYLRLSLRVLLGRTTFQSASLDIQQKNKLREEFFPHLFGIIFMPMTYFFYDLISVNTQKINLAKKRYEIHT